MRATVVFATLALAWAACSAPLRLMRTFTGGSTPTAEPTLSLEPTSSPTPRASATLPSTVAPSASPTIDLGPTPTPYPTFAIPTPSPTATAVSALDCKLDWQSPGNGIEFDREEKFTAGWKITNTGRDAWTPGSVEFVYLGGARLHRDPVVPLKTSVSPGQSVIVTAELKAPRNSTLYTTYWSLRQGDAFFCRVSLTIYVQ